ncbi:MAG: hypothetical protein ACPG80_04950, partial [Rickettsiales bacterium]
MAKLPYSRLNLISLSLIAGGMLAFAPPAQAQVVQKILSFFEDANGGDGENATGGGKAPAKVATPTMPGRAPKPAAPAPTAQPAENEKAPARSFIEELTSMGEDKELEPVAKGPQFEWPGSLMFNEKDVERIMALYRVYLESKETNTPIEEVAVDKDSLVESMIKEMSDKAAEVEIPEEVLNFTLDSILYQNKSDWSIWINGKIYARKDVIKPFTVGESELVVADITGQKVLFDWYPAPGAFEKTQQRWSEKQMAMDSGVESPVASMSEQVTFDENEQRIRIAMYPNQRFVSKFMTVMEGRGQNAAATPIVE